jgi:hypothetical protein
VSAAPHAMHDGHGDALSGCRDTLPASANPMPARDNDPLPNRAHTVPDSSDGLPARRDPMPADADTLHDGDGHPLPNRAHTVPDSSNGLPAG